MELLKKFDAQNYKDTTSVFEKYTIRGIIVRDGKIAMQCSKEGEYKIPGGGMEAGETYVAVSYTHLTLPTIQSV